MDKKNLLILFLILSIPSHVAAGSYEKFTCGDITYCPDFKCSNDMVFDATPEVRCVHRLVGGVLTPDCDDCRFKCAQACGEQTTCRATASETCEECCNLHSCKKYPDNYDFLECLLPGIEHCACQSACIGTCDLNTSFCYIVDLLRIVTGVLAAVLLAMNGLKWIISDDPHARTEARRGTWYVIVGAMVVLIASALVGFLMGKTACL